MVQSRRDGDGAPGARTAQAGGRLADGAALVPHTRRRQLLRWTGVWASAAWVADSVAWAAPAPLETPNMAASGGKAMGRAPQLSGRPESALSLELRSRGYRSDGLQLDFPELADSAHSVDFGVQVEAPAGRRLTVLEVILPENPFPSAVKLKLPQGAAQYRFSTRLRLAASQAVWVIATFDDGSVRGASAATLVTSSACLDES